MEENKDIETMLQEVDELWHAGEYWASGVVAKQVLDQTTDKNHHSIAYTYLGMLHDNHGNRSKALRLYKAAVERNPLNSRAHFLLHSFYFECGLEELAEHHYDTTQRLLALRVVDGALNAEHDG